MQLDHEDGHHRDHDRLPFAGRHLGDESLQIESLHSGRALLQVELEEAGHHEHDESLRVVWSKWRESAVNHELHPLDSYAREQLHVKLLASAVSVVALLHELHQKPRPVQEVDLSQLCWVVDAKVTFRVNRNTVEAHNWIEARLRTEGRRTSELARVLTARRPEAMAADA